MWLVKCIPNWVEQVNPKLPDVQASYLFRESDFSCGSQDAWVLTEVLSTDSAVVGQAVHMVCYVHS